MSQRGHIRLEGRTWRLYYRAGAPGERRRRKSIKLGTIAELPSRAAARAAADRFLATVNPCELHAGSVVPFREWCGRYEREHLLMFKRGTRKTRASIIRRHLLTTPVLDRPLHLLDTAAYQEAAITWCAAGAPPSTVRARFGLLRRILRAAREAGLAVTPPQAQLIRLPRDETVSTALRAKAFTPAEVLRILEAADDRLRTAVALARFAGLRAGEIVGLTWSAVALDAGRLDIRQQAQAGVVCPLKAASAAATLHVPAPLAAHLAAWRAAWPPNPDGFLFAGAPGAPLDDDVLRRALHRLVDRLGIPYRGLHGLRHACAFAMADAGCNPASIQRAMRHASIRTTMLYLTVTPEDIAAALNAGARDANSARTERAPPQEMQHAASAPVMAKETIERPASEAAAEGLAAKTAPIRRSTAQIFGGPVPASTARPAALPAGSRRLGRRAP